LGGGKGSETRWACGGSGDLFFKSVPCSGEASKESYQVQREREPVGSMGRTSEKESTRGEHTPDQVDVKAYIEPIDFAWGGAGKTR